MGLLSTREVIVVVLRHIHCEWTALACDIKMTVFKAQHASRSADFWTYWLHQAQGQVARFLVREKVIEERWLWLRCVLEYVVEK